MTGPPRYTLPRSARIRAKRDFDRIFREGMRTGDGRIALLGAAGDHSLARLGISVSRRYGKATRRNRIKRLVREAFRTVRHDLPPGMDWIVIPRPGREPTVAELQDSLLRLAGRVMGRLQSRGKPRE